MNRRSSVAAAALALVLLTMMLGSAFAQKTESHSLGNVNVTYAETDYNTQPVVRKATTIVFTGGTRWVKTRYDARLVHVSANGVAYKQLKLLKGERVLYAQASYVGIDDKQAYASAAWNGRGLKPIRTTMFLDGASYKMRLNSVSALIYNPRRPVPVVQQGAGRDTPQ